MRHAGRALHVREKDCLKARRRIILRLVRARLDVRVAVTRRQEIADGLDHRREVPVERGVRVAGQRNEVRVRKQRGKIAAEAHRERLVVAAVQHQRWHCQLREVLADVQVE